MVLRLPSFRCGAAAAALALAAAGCARSLEPPEPVALVPDDDRCVVEVVNNRDTPMAVTVHARDVHDLGVIQPARSARHAEECTPRMWTVSAVPRTTYRPSDPGDPTDSDPRPPDLSGRLIGPVNVSVEVRPGHVARVEL